ncbi:MAG TPA: glycosyltransferase [Pseudolabrys sp.]|nr:glycosyltransferase [Pseudolabrys sp.]
MNEGLAVICLGIWAYLLAGRGSFWRADALDAQLVAPVSPRPSVAIIVAARNEEEFIAASVESLLRQDYPGPFRIVLVDDDSDDKTASVATRAGGGDSRLTITSTLGPEPGWTGKLWALRQGMASVENWKHDYVLFTDADIVHAPDTLSWLVSHASQGHYVLTSLMAKLRCRTLAERSLVPAFVYFFQMLFPFAWVCRPESNVAAAAGGCMLIRSDALAKVGGLESIRNELIDDCSLAAKLKTVGPIWLGLTDRVHSMRPYETFSDVGKMISRSAYTQLRYSPSLLAATIVAMSITFIAPPYLALFATGWPRYLGLIVWLAMGFSFIPMLRFYRLSPLWSFTLPGIAAFYMYYTLISAYQHLRRRGGQWKGRVQVRAPGLQ